MEAGGLDDLLRKRAIASDLGGEFVRRVDRRDQTAGGEMTLAECRISEDSGDLARKLVDDRLRSARRREQPVPAARGRPGIAGLGQRRHGGEKWRVYIFEDHVRGAPDGADFT